ncbi:MAG: hypothetical protein EXQ49_10075 [Acidobacteria bacterium]|nr:hypothetical protein [Acidobacteriota bacterium]
MQHFVEVAAEEAPEQRGSYQQGHNGNAGAKGSVRFPVDQPMPLGLITKIVKFRVRKNLERAAGKK